MSLAERHGGLGVTGLGFRMSTGCQWTDWTVTGFLSLAVRPESQSLNQQSTPEAAVQPLSVLKPFQIIPRRTKSAPARPLWRIT